jgi:UDP-N-acetylmuramoyl-tripeptide--D-alanyl-D-alanine ligase
MRYGLKDVPFLLRTPVGRRIIVSAIRHRCLPVLEPLAALNRKTLGSRTRVIAVVGSLGKTTTARATEMALGLPPDPQGGANSLTVVAGKVLRFRPRQRIAVIEAGIEDVGQMAAFAKMLSPQVAIVTSISSEHNRKLKSLEKAREEKARMVMALPENGLAILNGDDPNVLWMRERTKARVLTFGFGDCNDVRATDVRLVWPEGTRFQLHIAGKTYAAATRLLGSHMVYPILAAMSVAYTEGRSVEQSLKSLCDLAPTPGRMQPIALPKDVWVLNDSFKSALESIHAALDVFASIQAGRRIIVMGDVAEPPGSQGPIYRKIGERIATIADAAVFIGNGYRQYAPGARSAGMKPSSMMHAGRSIKKAVDILRALLRPGDVVLLKGRDTQRLERIALLLQGRRVQCTVDPCRVRGRLCADCPMLETEWRMKRTAT